MARNTAWDFIDGYERPVTENGQRSVTGKRFFQRSYSGAVTQKRKRSDSMKIFEVGEKLIRLIAYTSTKAYGAMALSFGLVTLILHFMNDYFGAYAEAPTASLIIGAVFSIAAIPFLLVDRPISLLFQEIKITDYIFFEFFCIKRMHRSENEKSLPTVAAVIIGILPALLGYFVPVWIIAVAIGVLAFAYVAFLSPEFSFFTSFLVLPYFSYIPHSSIIFSALVGLTALSFLRKILYGKRVIYFEQYDFLLGFLMVMVLISGIFVKGVDSFASSVELAVAALGYMLASNIITNRRLADCALNAVVISSVPSAIVSICMLFISVSRGNAVATLEAGISSTFAATDVYSVFLIVAITFTVAMMKQTHGVARALYAVVLSLNGVALILTGELFALTSLLLGFAAYYSLKTNRWSALFIFLLFFVPYAIFLIPGDTLDMLFNYLPSNASATEMLEVWRYSLRAFSENIFIGVGIGSVSFAEEMAKYGIYGFTDSNNIFIELSLEAGIIALICFVLLLMVRLRHRAMYSSYLKNSQVSTLSPIIAVSVFCLLAFGATDYIWSDTPSFYLFWCVFGLGSATLRIAKKEHDDRVLYYEDAKSFDSSVIDVEIREKR